MERVVAIARPAERKRRRFFRRDDPWLQVLMTVVGWSVGFGFTTKDIVATALTTAAIAVIAVAGIIVMEARRVL